MAEPSRDYRREWPVGRVKAGSYIRREAGLFMKSLVLECGVQECPLVKKLRDAELDEARLIQRAMVPSHPLMGDGVTLISAFRPTMEVGGDFLDFFQLGDGLVGLYIGDVVGKGLPAALYAAFVSGTIRGIHKTGISPPAVLAMLNRRILLRRIPGRYCAVQYALFDPATGQLSHANGGIPPPIHISHQGCQEIGGGGLPSGLFEGAPYDLYDSVLEPGEAVLFHSDGLIEATDSKGRELGMHGLLEICDALRDRPFDRFLDEFFRAVDDYAGSAPQRDDMTAALLTRAR